MIYLRAKETIYYPNKQNEVFTKDNLYPFEGSEKDSLIIRDNKGYAHWISSSVAEDWFDVVSVKIPT